MLSKFSVAAAIALPLVSALTIEIPSQPTSDGSVTIKWTATNDDPNVFDLRLTNDAFHNTFAIANTVQTSDNSITLNLPTLQPGDGYTISATQVGNVNEVIGETSDFNIGASTVSSTSAASTSASSLASGTGSVVATSTRPVQSLSTSAFGSTVKASSTAASSGSGSGSAAAASSSAPNGAPVKFSFSVGAISVAVLSAVAGAAVVAL